MAAAAKECLNDTAWDEPCGDRDDFEPLQDQPFYCKTCLWHQKKHPKKGQLSLLPRISRASACLFYVLFSPMHSHFRAFVCFLLFLIQPSSFCLVFLTLNICLFLFDFLVFIFPPSSLVCSFCSTNSFLRFSPTFINSFFFLIFHFCFLYPSILPF